MIVDIVAIVVIQIVTVEHVVIVVIVHVIANVKAVDYAIIMTSAVKSYFIVINVL